MFSIKNEEKWVKISLAMIIFVFFAVSLYSVLMYGNANYLGSFDKMDNDDVKYIRSAWELLDNGNFIYHKVDEPTVFIMPGLTFMLAFFMKLFGKYGGITAFRVFQAVLQGSSMYLIFLIGRKVFNSKTALIGCILSVFYMAEYYAPTLILTETSFKFLLLLLVYLSIYAIEERSPLYYIAGGLVWGLACLIRPTVAAYPAVILIMWIIKKYKISDMVKFTIITTFVFAAVMSPWWIRNYKVYNRFIPLTLSSGNPFLQGTYINYDQKTDYTPYEVGKTAIETDENELKTGIYRLKVYGRKHPIKYLYWYTVGKTWELWNFPFYWKEMFNVSFAKAALYHHGILILGLYEAFKLFKKGEKNFIFIAITIVFFNIIYLPYFTFSRYSYPLMPMVCLIAASGAAGMAIKRRSYFGKTKDSDR
ncbi:ArnT family glycosyltransferase [Lutispora saccharofermentans]|uniref:Glycosyltransferase family 39 protein n=1 Tax=Lutispora saccharofermentans TaxID=3024236 RepID=A0ABT1NJ18_9FIRM|nr:glycosyltransferase family 39 protein [Lutispora saccharofermentans]